MLCDTASVLHVYDDLRRQLEQANLAGLMEPPSHVVEVERLRCLYRPIGEVRLLVIGESHVRVSGECFAQHGPAFIYNERYYTPWWRHLFLPAFAPSVIRTDRHTRLRLLAQMQASGVWILDASLVALSGYRKVRNGWNNRPFDGYKEAILAKSWQNHVSAHVLPLMHQPTPPVICALESVSAVLPDSIRQKSTKIRCVSPANSRLYKSKSYAFGMSAFLRAVQEAKINLKCRAE